MLFILFVCVGVPLQKQPPPHPALMTHSPVTFWSESHQSALVFTLQNARDQMRPRPP